MSIKMDIKPMRREINYLLKQIICTMLFIHTGVLYAQQTENLKGAISSNAANYQNVNIDLFHGRHNISIPIYNLKSKHLNVPISLDYTPLDTLSIIHHPGWVGLGWNLTAGGVITRSINGIPDETAIEGNFDYNRDVSYNPVFADYDPNWDVEEDEFSFNFCGYSGTFFYYRGEWKILSDVDFVVQPKIETVSGINVLKGFTLETPDGITYTFGESNATEYATNMKSYEEQGLPMVTSWFLTKIESPELDQINFEYNRSEFIDYRPITNKYCKIESHVPDDFEPRKDPENYNPFISETVANEEVGYSISTVYLARISSPTSPVSIKFNNSISNEKSYPGMRYNYKSYKLDNIDLADSDNKSFKRFDLTYIENPDELLKLKSVQESGISKEGITNSLPGYQLEYVTDKENTALTVLKKITYPTGGFSSFEFEKNDYNVFFETNFGVRGSSDGPVWNEGASNYLDGFRIKRQVAKSSDTDKAQVTDYYYSNGFSGLAGNNGSTGIKTRSILTSRNDKVLWADGREYEMLKVTDYDCSYPGEWPNATIKNPQIGYSSVWVVQSKEGESTTSLGYTNYRFVNYITFTGSGVNTRYIHNDFNEVGKISNCIKYDAKKDFISQTDYEYKRGSTKELDRYYVKSVTFRDYYGSLRTVNKYRGYSANYAKCYLSKKTTVENSFQTIITYKYNYTTNNLIEVNVKEPIINYASLPQYPYDEDFESNLVTTTTSYRYINEFAPMPYNDLREISLHLVKNIPVEKVVTKDGKVISAEFTKYSPLALSVPSYHSPAYIVRPFQVCKLDVPSPIDSTDYMLIRPNYDWSIPGGSNLKPKITFDKYDNITGDLLQYHNQGCAPVSIYYENSYYRPLIELRNCTYDCFNALNLKNTSDPTVMKTLRKQLPNAQITSYTYDPKFGVTSVTAPNGVTLYKEYDVFGRLKCIKDNNKKILQTKEYNYNIQ